MTLSFIEHSIIQHRWRLLQLSDARRECKQSAFVEELANHGLVGTSPSMSIACCHVVLQRMSRSSLDEHSVRQHRGRLLQLAESTGSVSSKRRSYSNQHALFKSLQQMTPSPRLATKLLSLEEVMIFLIVSHQFLKKKIKNL